MQKEEETNESCFLEASKRKNQSNQKNSLQESMTACFLQRQQKMPPTYEKPEEHGCKIIS